MYLPLRLLVSLALFGAGITLIGPGHAQTSPTANPSADDIVKSLSPTGASGPSRGIRAVNPTPGATAPGPTAPASTAHSSTRHTSTASTEAAPSVNLNVQFEKGSAELTAPAMRTLNQLGQALTQPALAPYRFRIEGHTDTIGSASYNKELSDRRAAAVRNYLATNFKVDPARLEAVGMGEEGLLVLTGDQTAEPRNRRVAVINLGS
ncbi:MAG TPA: OmpA family protein [Acetobacteraceae bacterium]|nr:OmpA family protein [Acetobacteraceae bacterium]